ncbi:unnamed protein product [Fraxinus pennsylvanica]|uniref:Uncharacterized protein n=1 Tax=Fraxinus pennsylvanica TaxID=56036 RepID=A0AAD2DYY4_9LAMI|nr:unnamed protein product [Fraxinus pennsylvanica]
MENTCFGCGFALIVLVSFFFHAICLDNHLDHNDLVIGKSREALEVIIGGGGGGIGIGGGNPPHPLSCSLPPPPSPCPFESRRLEIVYPIIQRFKSKIKKDPQGITKTWNGYDICNKYKGFFCDILKDYGIKALAGVNFNGFNFDGPELDLNGFIEELPDIIVFHANSNNFKGSFPSKISKLKYLYELDLSNNKYTSEFPYQILRSTKLTFLDLRFNKFSGLLPPQIFMLDLDVLFVNNNNFMQKLPDNLGSTPALYLTLANNKFIGPIPRSIGLGQTSKTLIEVLFLNNQLSGCLPYEIGLLEKATVFDVSRNFLTGPIPQSFACLSKMEILNLANNQFYGPVPELLCKLPHLGNLSLSNNYFTQIGPECWKLIRKKVLDFRMNCIPGLPMQRSPAQCQAFLSRPKFCPQTPMPCKGFSRNSIEPSEFDPKSIAPAKPPLSYTILNPHRL